MIHMHIMEELLGIMMQNITEELLGITITLLGITVRRIMEELVHITLLHTTMIRITIMVRWCTQKLFKIKNICRDELL